MVASLSAAIANQVITGWYGNGHKFLENEPIASGCSFYSVQRWTISPGHVEEAIGRSGRCAWLPLSGGRIWNGVKCYGFRYSEIDKLHRSRIRGFQPPLAEGEEKPMRQTVSGFFKWSNRRWFAARNTVTVVADGSEETSKPTLSRSPMNPAYWWRRQKWAAKVQGPPEYDNDESQQARQSSSSIPFKIKIWKKAWKEIAGKGCKWVGSLATQMESLAVFRLPRIFRDLYIS